VLRFSDPIQYMRMKNKKLQIWCLVSHSLSKSHIGFKGNNLLYRKIYINNSIVEVKAGDIFKEPGLKAIAFNEYFDTLVDEKIISSTTLNGKFIKQKITDIKSLDELIASDEFLPIDLIEW